MAKLARARKPERVCKGCGHAAGWHVQRPRENYLGRVPREELRPLVGGACQFEGCDCAGYARDWKR